MNSKVLVVTCSGELNVPKVLAFLRDEDVIRLNTDELLGGKFFFRDDEAGPRFFFNGQEIPPPDVGSVWYRRPSTPVVSQTLSEFDRGFVENEAQKFMGALWSVLPRRTIFWMNHPSVLRELEFNKPYQAQLARRSGLKVPETVITNELRAAAEFLDRWNGEVILKTFGGYSLRDEEDRPQSIFTNRVTREQLLSFGEEIVYAPVMLQNYVPKHIELRITAVGERFFACAIHSQDSERTRDDWRRYDFDRVRHEPYQLPSDVEAKLCRFMKEAGIAFGAIDMIVTPEGEHVFLEVNPSGQWGWIERLTGMPISQAVAGLLANPPLLDE